MKQDDKIARLESFKRAVLAWKESRSAELRTRINQEKAWVKQEVIAAGCFHTLTIGPPPAIGGPIMRGVDPFDQMFDPPYRYNLTSVVVDAIDSAIGALKTRSVEPVNAVRRNNVA